MSRAEYLRAYRAARRVQATHVCEGCGETFTPRRKDARFCSASCRGYAWRPVTHHALHRQPSGERCMQQTSPTTFCGEPAPWRHEFVRNRERHLTRHAFYCDEHIAAHVDLETVTIDEPVELVMLRDGRQARARHGIPVA